ncbi:MAG: cobyrinate a,c-diamide synthase [Lachnospiraceae bacterium]|nr:cobyrinate a,c-diamide synthase [Lachnospiraceae bacterium]
MENKVIKNHKPRVMIAAVSSSSGKTVITTAILAALKERDMNLSSFKCGPDYIDPMFHQNVLGIDSLNIDPYFEEPEGIRRLVAKSKGELSVIEGVMGIYDGIDVKSKKGSCYEIAMMTKTPIILIVNAQGIGATVKSVIKGVLLDDEENLIKGIILNRMSKGFYEKLRPQLESEIKGYRPDVCVLGCVPKDDAFNIGSRHLGLMMPGDIDDLAKATKSSAAVVEENCDFKKLIKIAEEAGDIGMGEEAGDIEIAEAARDLRDEIGDIPGDPCDKTNGKSPVRIAIARDEAFCFYYRENIRVLEELGAEPVYFSPLHDKALPENISGILLGGGYPELNLKALSANRAMMDSIKNAVNVGMPSLAECGGFMYLHDIIVSPNGSEYKMCGIINGKCTFSGHLVNFGYAKITGGKAGEFTGMKCHEFHYYESTEPGEDVILTKPSSGKEYKSMIAGEGSLWGFPHLYYRSNIAAIESFVQKMREYGN